MDSFTQWLLWLSLTLSFLYLLRLFLYRDKLPPGPTPFPIVGSLFKLSNMPHVALAQLAKTYGPVMSIKLGQVTTIVISSPDAAREVFNVHDKSLSARSIPDSTRALNHHQVSMVWLPPERQWKHLRTIVRTHLFTTQRLDANQGIRRRKVQEMVEHVRGRVGQSVDIAQAAFCTAINQISNTFFSIDLVSFNSDSAEEFREIETDIMDVIGSPNVSDFFPMLGAIDLQGRRRQMTVHLSKMYEIFDRMIGVRLQAIDRGEKMPNKSHDFLDALLQLHLQEDSKLDRRSVVAILVDVFMGGVDTSTNVIEWAMAELLRNPNIMSKLHTELTTVINTGRQLEEADISRLSYLQAVVKETLRLHPPGPFLVPRKAEKTIELSGYTVPENSTVMINVWAMARDERVWENAELFMPERFLTSEVDIRGQNFELTPFGSGRRICPGLSLALRMVHLMLGSLVHSFEWKLPDGMRASNVELKEKFGLTPTLASPVPASPLTVRC